MAEIEQAWQRGDYIFVRKGLMQHAEDTGTALAQFRYGRVLLEGRGGPRDVDAAITWLQKAADQNHVEAMTLLARVYLSEGFTDQDAPPEATRDPDVAVKLLKRAAPLGGKDAQYYLGQLSLAGSGMAQDPEAAFTWFLAAARQDHVAAQYELSRMYSRGIGTVPNAQEALHWLTQAAENGHVRAQYFRARALETGNGIAQNIPQAAEWYRRAAEGGLPIAQRDLGRLYLAGTGVPQNTEEGLRWLQAAAKAGDSGAMSNLGRAYAIGEGVAQDDTKAAEWYGRAVQFGLGRAMIALAALHETGRGVAQDMDQAVALYRKALETVDGRRAAIRLGQLAAEGALDGRVAPQTATPWALVAASEGDTAAMGWLETQAAEGARAAQAGLAEIYLGADSQTEKGAAFLAQAAQNGDAAAQLRLGQMHMTGDHVALDYVAAHKWFNIAATLGRSEARELRATAGALMTPDQLAEAQAAARQWFASEEPQAPQTRQTIRALPADETRSE
ncbi:MAG: hypothetical protein GJ677_02315 [Rhodobacteraceae bacterium]|nr:hypothetical protein [Paracoccaceae bacterium]